MEALTAEPGGSPQSVFTFIWFMWRVFPVYVFLRDGPPLLWLLGFLYVAPISFPAIPRLRAAIRRSWSPALLYICLVFAVALLCTGLELVSALQSHLSGGIYEGEEHLAVITLWPASALLFGIVFLISVRIFRWFSPSNRES